MMTHLIAHYQVMQSGGTRGPISVGECEKCVHGVYFVVVVMLMLFLLIFAAIAMCMELFMYPEQCQFYFYTGDYEMVADLANQVKRAKALSNNTIIANDYLLALTNNNIQNVV